MSGPAPGSGLSFPGMDDVVFVETAPEAVAPAPAAPAAPTGSVPATPLPARVPNCPVCASPLDATPRLCPRCSTPHHADCWDYVGDCAVFGCTSKALAPLAPDQIAWGTRVTRVWHSTFVAYSAAATALGLAFGLNPLVALLGELAYRGYIPEGLLLVAFFGICTMAGLGLAGVLLLAIPVLTSRVALESALGQPLRSGNQNAIEVARRMEPPGTPRVRAWVPALTAVCLLSGLVLALLESPPGSLAWVGFAFACALPILGLRLALRDMQVQIQTVQNRLLSSAKNL